MANRVIPHQPGCGPRFLAWLAAALMRLVAATLRWEFRDETGLLDAPNQPLIFCLWHNRLALAGVVFWRYVRRGNPARRMAAIASASKDGAIIARILEHFGAEAARGSSSRRGAQALLELTSAAARGLDLAVTPDGPRGPCYAVQPGIVQLAKLTGLPIVPAAINVSWKLRLKSWDRFQIPLPFAKCELRFAPPLRIPAAATREELEQHRARLEETMRALTVD